MEQVATEVFGTAEALDAISAAYSDLSRRSFGMPLNQLKPDLTSLGISGIASFTINNLGSPFDEGSYRLHSKQQEREVLRWLAGHYRLKGDDYWGYVTSCGSEGNFFGLYLGRETLRCRDESDTSHRSDSWPVLVYSAAAHYSIPKAGRILMLDSNEVGCFDNGEIDYGELEGCLQKHRGRPILLGLSIGTTLTGAVDDVEQVVEILGRCGIEQFHIHCDAALLGAMLPFMSQPLPIHFDLPIGSLSISAHKFLGSPLPSGVVLTRASSIGELPQTTEVTGSRDLTFGGSRGGLAVLLLWYLLRCREGALPADVARCIADAAYLDRRLRAIGWHSIHNAPSPTVAFRRPADKEIERRFQLSVQGELARIVVLPHIDRRAIDTFLAVLSDCRPLAG